MGLASGKHRTGGVDRVPRVRDQRDIPRVYQAQGHVPDPLLRPDEWQDLRIGVERHPKPLLVPARDGPAELGKAIALRVAVIRRHLGLFPQAVQDVLRCWDVRVPDGERDDVDSLGPLRGYLPRDLDEQVRGQLVDAARKLHSAGLLARIG